MEMNNMPQLTAITQLKATLVVVTGLRIGAGDSEMHIGGVDNTVIKHPHTQSPYIPGSSLKGKIRSLLEWRSGALESNEALGWGDYFDKPEGTKKADVKRILQLFGISGDAKLGKEMAELGPTRISFWDCALNKEWEEGIREDNQMLVEVKSENRISRISGEAEHPRFTERVPAGALFDFRLSIKRLNGDGDDLLNTVLQGLKLLELDSLGGSGSRGYGKVRFDHLTLDSQPWNEQFAAIKPFGA
jgi:CRISPR-associated protein Csm3